MNLRANSGRHRLASAAAAAVLAAVVLTSCSSSKPAHQSGSTGPSTGAPTATSTSQAATGGGNSASVAAIKDAYAKFFAPNTPMQTSLGLLQNGQAFKATIEAQAKGSLASKASAKVSKVSFVSADTAKVVFTIYISGSAALSNQPGYAVRENGTWKVAEYTFCGVLTLEGGAPPTCKSATGTSAPK